MVTVDPDLPPALERILERLRVRLFEYASSKGVGDRADDVVQETLALLWTKYAHVQTEADLVPLGYTICKYKIREARRRPGGKFHEPLDPDAPLIADGPAVDEELERRAERLRLREAIATLGLRCRQIFRLRLQERSTRQIATLMQTSGATLYVWEFRCRKALFEKLA